MVTMVMSAPPNFASIISGLYRVGLKVGKIKV